MVAPQPCFRVGVGGESCKFTGESDASVDLRVILQQLLNWPDQGRAKKKGKKEQNINNRRPFIQGSVPQ